MVLMMRTDRCQAAGDSHVRPTGIDPPHSAGRRHAAGRAPAAADATYQRLRDEHDLPAPTGEAKLSAETNQRLGPTLNEDESAGVRPPGQVDRRARMSVSMT
jgi:hypothetical protein